VGSTGRDPITIAAPRQAGDRPPVRPLVMLYVQSNPLPICIRLRVLIKGKRT
jgi:hypothetical protein